MEQNVFGIKWSGNNNFEGFDAFVAIVMKTLGTSFKSAVEPIEYHFTM